VLAATYPPSAPRRAYTAVTIDPQGHTVVTTQPSRAKQRTLALLATAAIVALLAACSTGERLYHLRSDVASRYMHAPVSQAMQALGQPDRERPVADLREYTWTTGVYNMPGGDCRLALIADRRGVVVDYRMEGTPRGCSRLLGSA